MIEILQKCYFRIVKIEKLSKAKPGKQFRGNLLNFQKEGLDFLLKSTGNALLADDMGLGKTIQAIGAAILLKRVKDIKKVLVISPASLKTEWEEQIEKFSDEKSIFISGNRKKREKSYEKESFFYLANYEQILYGSVVSNRKTMIDALQPLLCT